MIAKVWMSEEFLVLRADWLSQLDDYLSPRRARESARNFRVAQTEKGGMGIGEKTGISPTGNRPSWPQLIADWSKNVLNSALLTNTSV